MGPLVFVTLVAVLVVVIGCALFGMLLGMATLGRVCKRLFWPQLPEEAPHAAMPPLPTQAAPVSGQHCWDVKHCPPGELENCAAYKHPNLPCWVANMRADEGYRLKPDCLACTRFSLPALLN